MVLHLGDVGREINGEKKEEEEEEKKEEEKENLHAISCCQVSVNKLVVGEVLHACSYVQTHIQQHIDADAL